VNQVTLVKTNDPDSFAEWKQLLRFPKKDSHKGNNGKLLVIGGSELFHSSLIWAAAVAGRVVDMVHVASPAGVNERLVRERIKLKFLDGIVVPWDRVDTYVMEDDCVVIGPGMPRQEGLELGELSTKDIVNDLVRRFKKTRWVIDGGALQEIDWRLLSKRMIITPHEREYARLVESMKQPELLIEEWSSVEERGEKARALSAALSGATVLAKGRVDVVATGDRAITIEGGDEGLTKGGTGDVLAGLVGAVATTQSVEVAAVVASLVVKRAAELLRKKQGRWYSTSELVTQIPAAFRELFE
jgi:NAD(P)H-hydrate epimerase